MGFTNVWIISLCTSRTNECKAVHGFPPARHATSLKVSCRVILRYSGLSWPVRILTFSSAAEMEHFMALLLICSLATHSLSTSDSHHSRARAVFADGFIRTGWWAVHMKQQHACESVLHSLFDHLCLVDMANQSSPPRVVSLCTLSHWEFFSEVHYPWGSLHVRFPVCLALHGPSDGKCLLLLITHRWIGCSEQSMHSCVCLPVTLFIFVTVCIRKLWHIVVSLNVKHLLN